MDVDTMEDDERRKRRSQLQNSLEKYAGGNDSQNKTKSNSKKRNFNFDPFDEYYILEKPVRNVLYHPFSNNKWK